MLASDTQIDQSHILVAEIYLAQGRLLEAERVCHELRAEDIEAEFLLGRIYLAKKDSNAALACFKRILQRHPENSRAHFAIAEIEFATGHSDRAAQSWLDGLVNDPTHLPAHLGLTDALLKLELFEEAVIAAKQAILVAPNHIAAYRRLARAAEYAGDSLETIQALERCLELQVEPAPEELRQLAHLQAKAGNLARSRELLKQCVALRPKNAGFRFELGNVMLRRKDFPAALQQFQAATQLRPNFPEAYANMGVILRANRKFEEAEAAFKKACSQNPNLALAWNNLGNLYTELVRLDDAEKSYTRAISADPYHAEAHTGRAMLRLLQGRFLEGWDEYEWRWKQAGISMTVNKSCLWDGSSLDGKTILLHSEQGVGDTIQFIRYAAELKRHWKTRVLLRCQPALHGVLAGLSSIDEIVNNGDIAFDVHAPLMSLPRLLQTDLSRIPAESSYLKAPSGIETPVELSSCGTPRIGLVWSGNPNHHNDRNRSIPPREFAALQSIQDVTYFSLQVGGSPLPEHPGGTKVIDLAPRLKTYAETAHYLEKLDLVITVDTSVAHLAGALGRPVWMLLPACSDWRWLRNRDDSPWYPSMRLFRQETNEDWGDVLGRVMAAIEKWKGDFSK